MTLCVIINKNNYLRFNILVFKNVFIYMDIFMLEDILTIKTLSRLKRSFQNEWKNCLGIVSVKFDPEKTNKQFFLNSYTSIYCLLIPQDNKELKF